MDTSEMKQFIGSVKNNLRVTKIVATRSIKTQNGDHFAGFSAGWDTVQEDGEHGLSSTEQNSEENQSGMTLKEAQVAFYLVAKQADICAIEAAMANGNLRADVAQDRVKHINQNYSKLIQICLADMPSQTESVSASK